MKIGKFEDLVVWQKSKSLAISMYPTFRNCKDYGFKDQIQRAAISISNNLAEGFERRSKNELIQFFHIARGSCGEVRSMLYLAKEIGYIDEDKFSANITQTQEISRIITAFVNKTKNRN